MFAVGLKDEVTGTGVFGNSVQLKREGGNAAERLDPEAADKAADVIFLILSASLVGAVIASGI